MNDFAKRAKEAFGITDDFDKAGYLLTDGTLLDWSKRHRQDGVREHANPRRGHAELGPLYQVEYGRNPRLDVIDFMKRAKAIRLKPEAPGVEIRFYPTMRQVMVISEIANCKFSDQVFYIDITLDVAKPLRTYSFVNPTTEAILGVLHG